MNIKFERKEIPTEHAAKPVLIGDKPTKPGKVDEKGADIDYIQSTSIKLVADALGVKVGSGDGYDFTYKDKRVKVYGESCVQDVTRNHSAVIRPEDYQEKPGCDLYVFVRVKKDLSSYWIGGWVTPDQFNKLSRVRVLGQPQPCGYKPTIPGRAMRFAMLNPIDTL